jgi:hypothetical protein
MNRYFTIIAIFFILSAEVFSQPVIEQLIPKPRQAYTRQRGKEMLIPFIFDTTKYIYLNQQFPDFRTAGLLNDKLRELGLDTLRYKFRDKNDTMISGITFGINDSYIYSLFNHTADWQIDFTSNYPGNEGYILDITPSQILISASDKDGIFWSIVTLAQLIKAGGSSGNLTPCRIVDAPEFPVRWFYYTTNFQVGNNVINAMKIWKQASDLKLNGANLNDTKFSILTDRPQRYYDSLMSFKNFAEKVNIKIIPGVFPIGYSNSMLYWDPNLASGLPVRTQKFYIEGDSGRVVPTENVTMTNPGFETHNGDNFPGYAFIDQPGNMSFADTQEKHSGNVSLRFQNFQQYDPNNGNARVCYRTKVSPFKLYHVSAWIKTENFQPTGSLNISILGNKTKTMSFANISVPSTTNGWKKLDITFNSLESDTALVYWGAWGAKSGKLWWDDLLVEEVPFVNLIRRDGAPLNVSHPILDIAYIEGMDFDTLRDKKMGYVQPWAGEYDSYHQPPTFKIKQGGNLHNGDTILISYFNTIVIYDGQVMVTMSDPKVYQILEREFRMLDSMLKPETYFMQHDEIRVMNWDYGDLSRGLKPAEILADNVNKCTDIIKKYNPNAKILTWSDMFDEYHNAVPKNYYFVNGDLTGSADLIPNSVGMANWNGRNGIVQNSLKFFADKGFPQISAPYYDTDENQIRIWKEWTQNTPNFQGMMYTTWASDFSHLEQFSEYAWGHAPYIYHFPFYGIEPSGNFGLKIKINGDYMDKDWSLQNAQVLYRINPEDSFTSIDFLPTPAVDTFIILPLPQNNPWLQYYITAQDNKGWKSRIPLGSNQYFQLGSKPVSVIYNNNPIDKILSVYPNPVQTGNILNIEIFGQSGNSIEIDIYTLLGLKISGADFNLEQGINNLKLSTLDLNSGIYYLKIKNRNDSQIRKIVVID